MAIVHDSPARVKPGPETSARTSRSGSFAKVPRNVLKDHRLSASDRLVAAALASFDCNSTGRCWPSVGTLARDLGCSRRSVQIALRNLEFFGWIKTEENGFRDTHREYVLTWIGAELADAPPAEPSPRERVNSRRNATRNSTPCIRGGAQAAAPLHPSPNGIGGGAQALIGGGAQALAPELENAPTEQERENDFVVNSRPREQEPSDDDDVSLSRDSGEDPEGFDAAITAAELVFGPERAAIFRADSQRIGRQIGGRWSDFAVACYMAHGKKLTNPNPMGFLLHLVTKDYPANTVPHAEAAAVRKKLEAAQAKREAARLEREQKEAAARDEARLEEQRIASMAPLEFLAELARIGWTLTLTEKGICPEPMPRRAQHPCPKWVGPFIMANRPAIVEILEAKRASSPVAKPPAPPSGGGEGPAPVTLDAFVVAPGRLQFLEALAVKDPVLLKIFEARPHWQESILKPFDNGFDMDKFNTAHKRLTMFAPSGIES